MMRQMRNLRNAKLELRPESCLTYESALGRECLTSKVLVSLGLPQRNLG